jgi:hypothetical protein
MKERRGRDGIGGEMRHTYKITLPAISLLWELTGTTKLSLILWSLPSAPVIFFHPFQNGRKQKRKEERRELTTLPW